MIGWICRMLLGRFTSCKHTWVEVKKNTIMDADSNVIGYNYIVKCTQCGCMRQYEF